MPDAASAPLSTPTNYQRTAGGHLQWQPPTPEHLQEMLPTYEVMSILGQGGMGAVYKGRQKSLDRIVAIKILPPEAAEDDMQFAERFKNEARTMAKMNHPAIVHVYDFGETSEGQLYIVMEFIDGTDVAKMIQSQGKLPEDYALSITAHVCDALGYAHEQGVVHRDIKPANVLINMQGQVKVADFGLAKATDPSQMGLTKTNMAMGTPDFVSPEALMPGVPLDGRADLYAVGVMLYNMLTGTIPRGAFRMPGVTLKTDARFDKIILKAMEMDRENRYQTALDLRRDLDVILTTPAAKSGMQTIPAQAALPQKPMGKSPSAPQGKEGSAGTPARSAPAADKSARAPIAPAPKSNAVMIYGIAAAVVVAGGAFMFSGGGKKPTPAPKAVAETKPESKPATPPTAASKPKPSESKPSPAPALAAAGNEKWVDGLAQWFGGAKTKDDFVRENNGAARIGSKSSWVAPLPASVPPFRDQVVRVRVRYSEADAGEARLYVRGSTGKAKSYFLLLRGQTLALAYDNSDSGKMGRYLQGLSLPAGFDTNAVHTLELRVVGDLLTASLDGKKVGEKRDSQFAAGHPAIMAKNVVIESFEYANLDPAGGPVATAPAAAPVAPPVAASSSAKPGETLVFGGHRYQFLEGPFIKEEARTMAESLGGHLVTITSAEEQAWIEATFAGLIGGVKKGGICRTAGSNKRSGGSPPVWTNGEPWSYTNWEKGFPKETGANDYVVLTQNGGKCLWKTTFGSNPASALVEWDDAGTAKPAAPIAGAQPGKPVDLLALVDVQRDAVRGQWTVAKGGVVSNSRSGGAVLEFSNTPQAEYDFEIEFTIVKGHEVWQMLPVLGGNVVWMMGTGPQDRPEFRFGSARATGTALKPGQRYSSLIEVRKESLRALIDGKEILKWSGDPKRLTSDFAARNANFPGIGSYASEVTFHKAELRPFIAAAAPTLAQTSAAMPATAPPPAPSAPATPATPEDPRLAQLAAGFKARHDADALQPFNTAVAALNASYLANGIARARTAAQAKGSLAEVTALDAEKTAIEQGRGVPAADEADTPDSLKTLRGTYRTAHAKFATERDAKAAPLYDLYLKALDAYIAELTQADKIVIARKVQVFRDDIALQKPGAGATAPAATQKAAPTAPASRAASKPAVRAPKMNEHEVAEWAIASGGHVDVTFGTPPVTKRIAIASELPPGRFIITILRVNCDKVPGNDLSPLASAQDVGDLFLENSMLPDKTCVDLTPLRQMPKLGRLTTRDLDAAAVDVISSLVELHSLFIGSMPEGSLEKIAKLKQLAAFESPAIIGPGIAALKSCKQLRSLTNGGNPAVSDEDIRLLAATLPDLDVLNSGASAKSTVTAITNACIPAVLSLKSLYNLTLHGQELDDSVMEPLSKLPKLATLSLRSSKITGSNLDVLKKFSSLSVLYLDGCSITDEALDVLVQIKGLTKLQFRGTKVTDAGIAKFKAARPGFNISK